MIKRIPKSKPPIDIKLEDVKMATRNNGTIDFSKIIETKKIRQQERTNNLAKAHKEKKRRRKIIANFQEVYEEYMGGKYKLRPESFITRKIRNQNAITRIKVPSDNRRLWQLFTHIKIRYGGDESEYREYLEHSFDELMDKVTANKFIVGYITNEERVDDYFFKRSKKLARKNKAEHVRHRAEEHSQYFDGE